MSSYLILIVRPDLSLSPIDPNSSSHTNHTKLDPRSERSNSQISLPFLMLHQSQVCSHSSCTVPIWFAGTSLEIC